MWQTVSNRQNNLRRSLPPQASCVKNEVQCSHALSRLGLVLPLMR